MAIIAAGIFPSLEETLKFIGLHDWYALEDLPLSKKSGLSLVIEDIESVQPLPQKESDALVFSQRMVDSVSLLVEIGEWERAFYLAQLPVGPGRSTIFYEQLGSWGFYDLQLNLLQKLSGVDEPNVQTFFLFKVPHVYRNLGMHVEAKAYFRESIQHLAAIEYKYELAYQYHGLGVLLLDEPDMEEAQKCFHTAISLYGQLDPPDYGQIAACYNDLARPEKYYGNLEHAIAYHAKAIKIYEEHPEVGLPVAKAWVYHGYSDFLCDIGNFEEAEKYGFRALELFGERVNGQSWTYARLAKMYYYSQDYEKCRTNATKALDLFEQVGDQSGIIIASHLIGKLETRVSNYAMAYEAINKLTGILSPRKDHFKNSLIIDGFSNLALEQGNFKLATVLLSFMDKLMQKMEKDWTLIEEQEFQNNRLKCQTKLGNTEYGKYWEEGQTLNIDQVITLIQERF